MLDVRAGLGHVLLASSAGTLIEWYDFYLYAILTVALSGQFFPAAFRYTSMSIAYHLGNGEFGGLPPLVASWLAAWWIANHQGDVNAD